MRDTSNLNRRADLQRALKKTSDDDLLRLEDLALLWGVTKQRFVTVRNHMADFPQHRKGAGNEYVYPAKAAITSMLAYETRNEAASSAKAARIAAIVGRPEQTPEEMGHLTINEMAQGARLQAEIEERERDQGLYAPLASIAAVAGDVFGEISEFMRGLSNKMDPNGQLPPEQRVLINSLADEFLLRIHRKMRDVLSPDAKPAGNRKAPRRSKPSRA